jgi:ADP-ribosylglycohydrolase
VQGDLIRAARSLEGLATGDAFGELFFSISPHTTPRTGLPQRPWRWTDDTHMALSIVEVLREHGRVEQDALAQAFARRFHEDPSRGYGSGAATLLKALHAGADWRIASPGLFGTGSHGNGASMRVAPLGAYFAEDPGRAAREARLSAVVTHAHPEGIAGAIAVAAGAAMAARSPGSGPAEFLKEVLRHVPEGLTKDGVRQALDIPGDDPFGAADRLGTGMRVSAHDTVPFCLWVAAHHPDDFEEALWVTVKGMGDVDTTCAIVGGIVALSAPRIPAAWLERREPVHAP